MKIKRILIVPLLVIALLSQACTDEDRKKVAQASDDLARGTNIAFEINSSLYEQRLISKDDALTITSAIVDVVRIGNQFTVKAKSYKDFNADAKMALLKIVDDLADSLAKLNQTGTLKIKSPNSQAQFQAAYAVMTSAVAVLKSVLQKGGGQ